MESSWECGIEPPGSISHGVRSAGKRALGRTSHRCQDNVRMDLKEMGINTRNWVDSAQDRDYWRALGNEALNLRII